jgi:colanic acid biosynthesis glycosyl transferase WcaI
VNFLFLNQFAPPDPAPTARLSGEVAEALRDRGHEVAFVSDGADYRGGKTLLGSRALREASSLVRLFFRTLFAKRADVIVCLTSPPLVPVVAGGARIRHRGAKLIHWAMDLYPEVAVALGEVREGSLLHRVTSALMTSVYRSCDGIVVLDDAMQERIATHGAESTILPPWPPAPLFPETGTSPEDNENAESLEASYVWLYSGNLGRVHEWKTLLDAQALLESEGIAIDLIFQGGGAGAGKAQAYAESLGLTRCHWRPYAEEEELVPSLLAADCLLVTQRPETNGCLWPSKLALVRLLERPVVWVGETGGGIARQLREEGHHSFAPGESALLAEAMKSLLSQKAERPAPDPARIRERIESERRRSIATLADRFEAIANAS